MQYAFLNKCNLEFKRSLMIAGILISALAFVSGCSSSDTGSGSTGQVSATKNKNSHPNQDSVVKNTTELPLQDSDEELGTPVGSGKKAHKKGASSLSDDGSTDSDELTPGVSFSSIYFDYNRYNIREDQEMTVHKMAAALKKDVNIKIQIQGNTDDRGSVEYNLALGQRRADSLKEYLVLYGVPSKMIETMSYGKERPKFQGDSETVWAQNRRDDVVFVGH